MSHIHIEITLFSKANKPHSVIMYQSYSPLKDGKIHVDTRLNVTHYIGHERVIWIGLSHEQLNGGEDCGDV